MGNVSQGSSAAGVRMRAKRWLVASLVLFLGVAALLLSVAMGWIMPRQYESTAVIRVNRVADAHGALTPEEAAEVMESEARRVTSLPTLDRVGDRLDLPDRWEMDLEEVREALREAVAVEVVPDSGLIKIHVRQTEAEEAQVLAYAVAEAYRDLRTTEELSKARGMLEALDAELEEQEREVEEKRKALDRLIEESGLDYVEREKQTSLLRDLKEERATLEKDLHFLQELRGDSLYRHAAGLERAQNSAVLLYEEFERIERLIVRLRRSGLGDSHPQIVAQDIQQSLLRVELERSIKELMGGVTSDLERVIAQLDKTEQSLSEPVTMSPAVVVAIANRAGNVPVWHAVRSARAELAGEAKISAELRLRRVWMQAKAESPRVEVVPAD